MIDTPRFSRATILHAVTAALNGSTPHGWANYSILADQNPDGTIRVAIITNAMKDEKLRQSLLMSALRKEFQVPDHMPMSTFTQLMADAYKEPSP